MVAECCMERKFTTVLYMDETLDGKPWPVEICTVCGTIWDGDGEREYDETVRKQLLKKLLPVLDRGEYMTELLNEVEGDLAWVEDGSLVDLEESIERRPVQDLIDRVKQIDKYKSDLLLVVDAMTFEQGLVEGIRGADIYNHQISEAAEHAKEEGK